MGIDEFLKKRSTLTGFQTEKDADIIGLDLNIMQQEHVKGVKTADSCCIPYLADKFAWMRGHQNCITGFPNDGKSQFALFLMIVKAVTDGWKFTVWSPEMKGANYVDGKVKVHYNTLAYDIMAPISGKTPYRHIHNKYGIPILSVDELHYYKEWIDEYFVFLNPVKKDIKYIHDLIKRVYDLHGHDAVLIDPYKNIEAEHNLRDDKHLHQVFSTFKDLSIETNSVMNWIAHPKSGVSRISSRKGEDILVPCNQYMLSGGAAWDNSMDGIYSIQRPNALNDISSPDVAFHNLKQRMQDLVANRGVVNDIVFDVKTRRYLFNGYDPLKLS